MSKVLTAAGGGDCMGMKMGRIYTTMAIFAAALACGVMFGAGCGGGAGGGASSPGIIIDNGDGTGSGGPLTGTVTAPSGVRLDRAAAATGLDVKTYVPVFVYRINDSGGATTYWLASALTNDSGVYTLTIPTGYAPSSSLVAACGTGNNLMRAFVTATGTININPLTEVVVSKVAAATATLSNFATAELVAMQSQVNTDGAAADFTGKTTIADAVSAAYTGTLKTNLDAAIAAAGAN